MGSVGRRRDAVASHFGRRHSASGRRGLGVTADGHRESARSGLDSEVPEDHNEVGRWWEIVTQKGVRPDTRRRKEAEGIGLCEGSRKPVSQLLRPDHSARRLKKDLGFGGGLLAARGAESAGRVGLAGGRVPRTRAAAFPGPSALPRRPRVSAGVRRVGPVGRRGVRAADAPAAAPGPAGGEPDEAEPVVPVRANAVEARRIRDQRHDRQEPHEYRAGRARGERHATSFTDGTRTVNPTCPLWP